MEVYTGLTRAGRSWTPEFLEAVDPERCIGCGRCYKVCAMGVLKLAGVDEDGNLVEIDEDDDDGDIERKVMTLADAGNCVGCKACGKVCTKAAHSYRSAPVAAA